MKIKIVYICSIQVKYAPKVTVSIVEGALDTGQIPIENAVRLRCETDANPNEITYQWYINEEMIVDAKFNEFVSGFLYCYWYFLQVAQLVTES